MRRIILAAGLAMAAFTATACQPTPVKVTATPSTTRPACEAVTTVTGKASPAGPLREVTLVRQIEPGGSWTQWRWFENASDGMGPIEAKVDLKTGAFSLTYLAPNVISQPTTRLRVQGRDTVAKVDVASTSWYVTKPTGCQ